MRWSALFSSQEDVDPSEPPFPSRQLFVLAVCRICEPIAFMSIFPYAYYMVLSFNLTSDPNKIAIYVGMITSAFAFAEFSSGVIWGRVSDRIGRKPVLLAGLAGTALSMIVFGFATNLPMALLARALGGLLNGNMGVLQTTVAELVTVKEHQPRAFSIMPFVWCFGSVLGPAMGGALAEPCKTFPDIFLPETIFHKFPFLLPNLVCTAVLAFGVLIGILFLEETHAEKKYNRDYGLETGEWLLRRLKACGDSMKDLTLTSDKSMSVTLHETHELLDDEELPEYSPADDGGLPGYRTTDGTPRQSSSRCPSPGPDSVSAHGPSKDVVRGTDKAFTKQVVLVIAAFGILAYHSISFDQLMPVFLSEPISMDPPSLPLYFRGGFGYSTEKIGFMLAVQGVYSMAAQLFVFPLAARKLGSLNTLRLAITLWPILYISVPYAVLLPIFLREPAVYVILLLKITFHVLAFPATAILVTNAAPSRSVLGLINGASASTASLSRAFSPTITGAIHTWGLHLGMTGLAWWIGGIVCLFGAMESSWMQEVDRESQISRNACEANEVARGALLDPLRIEAAISAADDSSILAKGHGLHESDSKISCCEVQES